MTIEVLMRYDLGSMTVCGAIPLLEQLATANLKTSENHPDTLVNIAFNPYGPGLGALIKGPTKDAVRSALIDFLTKSEQFFPKYVGRNSDYQLAAEILPIFLKQLSWRNEPQAKWLEIVPMAFNPYGDSQTPASLETYR